MRTWWLALAAAAIWTAAACAAEPPILALDAGGHTATVKKVLFTPDGQELITVSDDKTIRFWEVATGEPLRVLRPQVGTGHRGKLFSADISPDGTLLAVGGFGMGEGRDGLQLIELRGGNVVRQLVGHSNAVNDVRFSPNGQWLLSGSIDRTACFWDVNSGALVRRLSGHSDAVYGTAFSPDGRRCATASYDHTAAIWSVDTGRLLHRIEGHQRAVTGIDWSPDGSRIATAGKDGTLRVWSSEGNALTVLRDDIPGREFKVVRFTADGQKLLFAHGYCEHTNGFAGLTSSDRIQLVAKFDQHRNTIFDARLSPDGRLAASTGGDRHATCLWRTTDGELVRRFSARGAETWGTAWAADGRTLAWGDSPLRPSAQAPYSLTRLFDPIVLEPSPLGAATDALEVRRAILERDQLMLLLAGDSAVRVKRGDQTVLTLQPTGDYDRTNNRALAASHLPRDRIAVGSAFDLWIYDARTGNRLRRCVGHTGQINAVAPSPDGRYLLSSSGDMTLRIWPLDFEVGGRTPRNVIGPKTVSFLESVGLAQSLDSPHGFFAIPDRLKDSDNADHRRFGETFRDQNAADYAAAKAALETGIQPLLSLFFAGDDWIAWTPEGYYAASPGGERLMGWHVNNGPNKLASFYPAAHFRKQFYRPDVIKLLLQAGSVERALELVGTGERLTDVSQSLPPLVEIVAPSEPALTTDRSELAVTVQATQVGSHPVTSLQLLLNGRPLGGKGGIVRLDGTSRTPRHTFTVPLISGVQQLLQARADSAVSYNLSQPLEVTAKTRPATSNTPAGTSPSGSDDTVLPALYVLAIGVADYDDGELRLSFADDDARNFAAVVQQHSAGLFREIEVQLLVDKEATQRGILGGLNWLKKQMTQHDVGVVFYSGHGERDGDGVFYLLPSDVDRETGLLVTGVSDAQVKTILQGMPGRTLVLLDACHAGSLGGDKRKADFSLTDDLVRDLATDDYGIVVMASSMGREFSLENSAQQSGMFTLALCEGLRGGADFTQDGLVHFNELDAYVSSRVKDLTQGRQHPATAKPATIRSFPPLPQPGPRVTQVRCEGRSLIVDLP